MICKSETSFVFVFCKFKTSFEFVVWYLPVSAPTPAPDLPALQVAYSGDTIGNPHWPEPAELEAITAEGLQTYVQQFWCDSKPVLVFCFFPPQVPDG